MMYSNKLAVAIKANGKVLRDTDDTVFIPFGSEYTILIKNLNNVRAQVRIEIDGTSATGNVSLVIPPNDQVELKRTITNGNMTEGNAFKFIERTSQIENHRGVKVDDGLIRVEFQFEALTPQQVNVLSADYKWPGPIFGDNARTLTRSAIATQSTALTLSATTAHDVGITVPGRVINQQFTHSGYFLVEPQKHAMVLRLMGESPLGQPIKRALTTKHKPKCDICGHLNKATAKFCSNCGASVVTV